ncbi:ABC transporter ATP-binding protein [Rathayibacter sp. YIM 133350]|uniref:ABC transporter ATP-binding protein n=1 Tax=Rathayibacter sp. YIM 133350 TaxID=3131992 RepID=UPI00307D29E8
MSTPILSLHDVHKSYGRGAARFGALSGVSFDVYEGESLAIVGKSGSGKSTLMHLMALLDAPTSGTIELAGTDAAGLHGRALNVARNKTFGFVFQQFFLTGSASVLENVMLPLKIAGVRRTARRKRALEALKALELDDKARNRASDLSGGQKQRAVIARALVNDPRIIFADEPTGNLDSATGTVVEDILFTLNREQGITLIIVTHDEDLAARCDRSIHVRDGRIVDIDAKESDAEKTDATNEAVAA